MYIKHNVCQMDIKHACVYGWAMKAAAFYKYLGSAIRAQRRVLGLTQRQLAGQLGISRASLANVETGRQRVLVHQLYELASQLNTSVDKLLPESSEVEALQALDDLLFSQNVTVLQRQQIARLLTNNASLVSALGGLHDSVPRDNGTGGESSEGSQDCSGARAC